MIEVSLANFRFDKRTRRLITGSKLFDGRFPSEFAVASHHTGRVVTFKPVGVNHPLFDEDGWDGEQQIYEAVDADVQAKIAIVCHGF